MSFRVGTANRNISHGTAVIFGFSSQERPLCSDKGYGGNILKCQLSPLPSHLKGVEIETSSGQMKVLAILLGIAIGHVFGEPPEISQAGAEESLRVDKDVVVYEAGSRVFFDDGRRPARRDENNLQRRNSDRNSFYQFAANADEAESVVKDTFSANPSPISETSIAKLKLKPLSTTTEKHDHLRKPAARFLGASQGAGGPGSTGSRTTWKAAFVDFLRIIIRASTDERKLRSRRKRQTDDPEDRILSYRTFNNLRKKLPLPMRLKIRETTLAEDYLLDFYASAGTSDDWRLREYNRTRFDELEEFKREIETAGDGKQELIDNYKAVRKGVPWNYDKMRDKYKTFFSQESPGRTEYEAMKAKESSVIDSIVSGADMTQIAAAGVKGQIYSSNAEEMEERGVRDKDVDTVDAAGPGVAVNENDADDDVVASTDDVRVDVTNTSASTAQAKAGSILVRIAVLIAVVTQAIIAVLFLGPGMVKLVEWWKRRKTEEDILAAEEREPLYARKRYFQLGRTRKYHRLISTAW